MRLKYFSIIMISITVNVAHAAPDLPSPAGEYASQSDPVKARVCGEMLVGLAIAGQRSVKQALSDAESGLLTDDALKAKMTKSLGFATDAVFLLKSSSNNLTPDQKAAAKAISRRVEAQSSSPEYLSIVTECQAKASSLSAAATDRERSDTHFIAASLLQQVQK